MGLDMYLTKRTKAKHEKKLSEPIEVAYWRKANAIHGWFDANSKYGIENCRSYKFSIQQLLDLLDLCKTLKNSLKLENGLVENGSQSLNGEMIPVMQPGQIITNPDLAQKLLPAMPGFFFGSYNYDNYYLQEIDDTINQVGAAVDTALAEAKLGITTNFYYYGSW